MKKHSYNVIEAYDEISGTKTPRYVKTKEQEECPHAGVVWAYEYTSCCTVEHYKHYECASCGLYMDSSQGASAVVPFDHPVRGKLEQAGQLKIRT